jgi:hypothetical protein
MIDQNFVFLGALINLQGSLSYVVATLKGETKPNRVTWFLWALAPLVAFSAEIGQGVGVQSLMTFMVGFGPLMIFIASFINKKSFWNITRLDIVCGVLSVLALVLWWITRSGDVAIIFSILADIAAGIPTLLKAYGKPETENAGVFRNGALSAAITLLTIKNWTIGHYAFPLYIFVICLILYSLIRFKFGIKLSKLARRGL